MNKPICVVCSAPFRKNYSGRKLCSFSCRSQLIKDTAVDRFWGRLNRGPGCWVWSGRLEANGQARVHWNGRQALVHRVAWELTYGPIPEGILVCHKCDNPSCACPSHLFLGTQVDNMQDCARKGRNFLARGEKSGRAKLTDRKVLTIRKLAKQGLSLKAIGERYQVHAMTVGAVVRGRTWTHVK